MSMLSIYMPSGRIIEVDAEYAGLYDDGPCMGWPCMATPHSLAMVYPGAIVANHETGEVHYTPFANPNDLPPEVCLEIEKNSRTFPESAYRAMNWRWN